MLGKILGRLFAPPIVQNGLNLYPRAETIRALPEITGAVEAVIPPSDVLYEHELTVTNIDSITDTSIRQELKAQGNENGAHNYVALHADLSAYSDSHVLIVDTYDRLSEFGYLRSHLTGIFYNSPSKFYFRYKVTPDGFLIVHNFSWDKQTTEQTVDAEIAEIFVGHLKSRHPGAKIKLHAENPGLDNLLSQSFGTVSTNDGSHLYGIPGPLAHPRLVRSSAVKLPGVDTYIPPQEVEDNEVEGDRIPTKNELAKVARMAPKLRPPTLVGNPAPRMPRDPVIIEGTKALTGQRIIADSLHFPFRMYQLGGGNKASYVPERKGGSYVNPIDGVSDRIISLESKELDGSELDKKIRSRKKDSDRTILASEIRIVVAPNADVTEVAMAVKKSLERGHPQRRLELVDAKEFQRSTGLIFQIAGAPSVHYSVIIQSSPS